MKISTIRRCIPIISFTIAFTTYAVPPPSWQSDCVGRAVISLPPNVELAAVPHNSIAEEITGAAMLSEAKFKDGQVAGWSRIIYTNGLILVSTELNSEEIADLRSRLNEQPERERRELKQLDTSKSRAMVVSRLKTVSPQILAWSLGPHISYLQQLGNHVLFTGVSSDNSLAASTRDFESLSANTTYREIFSVPSESGVCLPFSFIKDRGVEPRSVSVTYRLKSHPDVTVVLTDANALVHKDPIRKRNAEPEVKTANFWAQYEVSRTGKEVRTRWFPNSKRAIEMDGRKGIASFVNIVRKDDSKDVGFLAIVPGDPTAKTDAPELTLFVVREANHARAKGIEPITEEAFLELARSIASSVQVRKAITVAK
ncbi:T6SS immunity protein Tli4 family protein [Massilia sp. SR12]